MTRYVLGFAWDPYTEEMIFIKKNRPAWQKGLFNGVGGKIEDGELDHNAMVREFYEETGALISSWHQFLVMKGKDFEVVVFYALLPAGVTVSSKTDEKIYSIHPRNVYAEPHKFIENIPWILKMIDSRQRDNVDHYVVEYVR